MCGPKKIAIMKEYFEIQNLKLKITTYLRADFVCYLNPHGSFMLVERLLWTTW